MAQAHGSHSLDEGLGPALGARVELFLSEVKQKQGITENKSLKQLKESAFLFRQHRHKFMWPEKLALSESCPIFLYYDVSDLDEVYDGYRESLCGVVDPWCC